MKDSYPGKSFTVACFVFVFIIRFIAISTTRTMFDSRDFDLENDNDNENENENDELLDEHNSTASEHEVITINTGASLEELCDKLNISRDVCSCAVTAWLCPFEAIVEHVRNTSRHEYKRSEAYTLIYVSLTVFVSTFGVIGNTVVVLLAFHQRRHLPVCKLHIAQLAVINLIFSVLQIVNGVPLFWTNIWIYGTFMCKLIRTLIEISTLLSILFIMLIAIERFVLIVHPSVSRYFEKKLKHVIIGIYLIIVCITVFPFYIGMCVEEPGRCVQFGNSYKHYLLPYNWSIITIYFLLPGITVTSLYSVMIKYISLQASNINPTHNAVLCKRKLKTNRRVVYITLIILSCFLFCTLPTRASIIYMEIENKKTGENLMYLDPDLYFTLTMLSYVTYPFQSAVNPILYSMVDSEWRRDLRVYFSKVFCKSSNKRDQARQGDCGNFATRLNHRHGKHRQSRANGTFISSMSSSNEVSSGQKIIESLF